MRTKASRSKLPKRAYAFRRLTKFASVFALQQSGVSQTSNYRPHARLRFAAYILIEVFVNFIGLEVNQVALWAALEPLVRLKLKLK